MLSAHDRRSAAGLSLIELMVVLVVVAMVLSMAAPAMGRWVRELNVRSSATTLQATLAGARAEAVARHTELKLLLGDADGRPGWTLSCVRISPTCPAVIRRQLPGKYSDVRWRGTVQSDDMDFAKAPASGIRLPLSVHFNATGAAPAVADRTGVARIDISHADDKAAQRLIVLISAQGMARICNPSATDRHPEHCH